MPGKPRPDNGAAVEFLRRWRGGGPWVLTAISTDRKSINTRTFREEGVGDLEAWLTEHNGKNNVYFHVNPTVRDLEKKADREDVAALDWLHVDIDPRAGEDVAEEQARALSLLTERLPKGVPPPTVVIFSGGGYQGFWRLADPMKIGGEMALAEEAKRYNVQLEFDFGADNCHNVDRIMRLPGTVNIPDAKKRKKGRQETLARLVEFNDNVYPLADFKQAPQLQTEGGTLGGGTSGIKVEVAGDVERVNDVSELDKWDVPDRVKVIMVQGRHPDQPKQGDDSRSAWLFDFCCQLVRHEVPDEVIFSIITDPDWGISESVLEMKSNAEKYALKQIQSAKEHAVDPYLAYFNKNYWVCPIGDKVMVLTERMNYVLDRKVLVRMSLPAFEQLYENKFVEVGRDANDNPKFKPAGTWWRYHKNRRQYKSLVFSPEHAVPEDCYNMWRGFAFESRPGQCDRFLAHVRDNVCAGDEGRYAYLMGWLARTVQHPGSPGEVAVVLRGGRGTGKSFLARVFGSLFGRHYMQVSNSSHLVGNFNSHLQDLVVLFADEAFYAGDKKHESVLKTLVTEPSMVIERKGVDVESAPNCIHLIMASNEDHVVPAGADERRFFVLDVSDARQKDAGYFGAIAAQLEDGGYEALLHTLLTWDLSGFDVRAVPDTEALREQKLYSLSVDEEWWYQKLYQGQLLYRPGGEDWPAEVVFNVLLEDYTDHNRRHQIMSNKRSSETRLGRYMKKALPRFSVTKRQVTYDEQGTDGFTHKRTRRALVYRLPPLQECRDHWEKVHGHGDWPEEDEQPKLPGGGRSGEIPF